MHGISSLLIKNILKYYLLNTIEINTFDLDIKEGKEVSIKPKKINQDTK